MNIALIGDPFVLLFVCFVNTFITEPPTSTTIIEFHGQEVETIAGPYQQDTIVTLTFVSSGG